MKPIQGYEGLYSVTEDGKVWSHRKKLWVSQYLSQSGGKRNKPHYHYSVNLYIDVIHITKQVHRLVAEAFIPNPENKPQVNHKDGDPLNNCVSNLEWATNKENSSHAFDIGICKKPLTREQVIEIRKLCKVMKTKEVAEQFKIKPATIWDIKYKRTYAEVMP